MKAVEKLGDDTVNAVVGRRSRPKIPSLRVKLMTDKTQGYQPAPLPPGAPPPVPPQAEDTRPPPKKPVADPEAREEWLKALRTMQNMKPPAELNPLQRAWVQMYCTAISTREVSMEYAARVADYGVNRLQESQEEKLV